MRLLKLLSILLLTAIALTAQLKSPPRNADVVKMVKAGLTETTS